MWGGQRPQGRGRPGLDDRTETVGREGKAYVAACMGVHPSERGAETREGSGGEREGPDAGERPEHGTQARPAEAAGAQRSFIPGCIGVWNATAAWHGRGRRPEKQGSTRLVHSNSKAVVHCRRALFAQSVHAEVSRPGQAKRAHGGTHANAAAGQHKTHEIEQRLERQG